MIELTKLIAEMEQHIKLVVEYQTLLARRAPRDNANYELRTLLVDMMEWVKCAKQGQGDLGRAYTLAFVDSERVLTLAKKALWPDADVYMHVWYERYCELMAE